ncbi:MAG: hypothetical protein Q8S58_11330 [Bosea sp. (in: a-proteobacteria)]|uniref:hypothetical protein n=1 Tax=Bosea sp. (in: a-proteobacteria) TaxID=1871050 RepID=UPI002732FC8E|nr:hypothetical protein [Bosea sp. (in: a-proteobacteria)]MDP3256495.1 hypothetical protein [Bosea sp. (in: a-proteobacteria)]MDP3319712.1 hypothetical protein [Bosea sp. (in: a-proteobacteria)]
MTTLSSSLAAAFMAGSLASAHAPVPASATAPRDLLFACMEEQRVLPPALRAATCQCYVEKAQAPLFRMEAAFVSAATLSLWRGNLIKECLATERDIQQRAKETPARGSRDIY